MVDSIAGPIPREEPHAGPVGLDRARTRAPPTLVVQVEQGPTVVEKLIDGVGPYMNPPERAVIFSKDEKPRVQSFERTRAVLPMAGTWPEGRPHDFGAIGRST